MKIDDKEAVMKWPSRSKLILKLMLARKEKHCGMLNLPVWGWAPCHGGQWGGCSWARWTGPKLLQQSPETPPERGSGGRSSWRTFQEPEWKQLYSVTPSTLRVSVRLAHTATAYSQRQHDLLEVPIAHDSLLQSFDWISGPANNRHVY